MVSQSKNGSQKNGFSIKKWFPKKLFLNQKMIPKKMVSQSKNDLIMRFHPPKKHELVIVMTANAFTPP